MLAFMPPAPEFSVRKRLALQKKKKAKDSTPKALRAAGSNGQDGNGLGDDDDEEETKEETEEEVWIPYKF